MKFVYEIDSNNRFVVRHALENELIRIKGRVDMNKANHNIEPTDYELETITKIQSALDELDFKKQIMVFDDNSRIPV